MSEDNVAGESESPAPADPATTQVDPATAQLDSTSTQMNLVAPPPRKRRRKASARAGVRPVRAAVRQAVRRAALPDVAAVRHTAKRAGDAVTRAVRRVRAHADARPWLGSAPVLTLGFFALTGCAYYALGLGDGATSPASTQQWAIWKFTAALGVAIAVFAAGIGVATLSDLPAPVTLPPGRTLALYVLGAATAVAAVFGFVANVFATHRGWPAGMEVQQRLAAVTFTVGAAAIPWLVLVWILHRTLREERAWSLTSLLRTWDLMSAAVLAFAVFVVLSLVLTGALRVAWFAKIPKEADNTFPTSDVLAYGAFFAVLLSAVALPLVAAWRRRARELVGDPPAVDDYDQAAQEKRARLEALLHLDTGVLRNPIAALAVFTPLITAALAAFVPQLG